MDAQEQDEQRTIHLATGIVCGGPPTWCEEALETEYDEERGVDVVTNATQSTERYNCEACHRKYSKAVKDLERRRTK